jgi:hypothetical protein
MDSLQGQLECLGDTQTERMRERKAAPIKQADRFYYHFTCKRLLGFTYVRVHVYSQQR